MTILNAQISIQIAKPVIVLVSERVSAVSEVEAITFTYCKEIISVKNEFR